MSALHTLNLGTYVATSDWMEPLVEAIQLLTLAILLHDGTYGPPQVWRIRMAARPVEDMLEPSACAVLYDCVGQCQSSQGWCA